MKILYFGTVCNIVNYQERLKKCRNKPTIATIVFESALLEGFKKNDTDIEIYSFPMIPTFPNSCFLHFGSIREDLSCGYSCHWLNTINLPILKQWSRRADARNAMKRWIAENGSDGIIMTYSIPPFLVKDIVRFARKHQTKIVAIIPDLLRNMYINQNQSSVLTSIKNNYIKTAIKLQSEYDGYIYLTEAMRGEIAPHKPYVVMEGIANLEEDELIDVDKSTPKAIMYAGRLHEKYGIIALLDAFEKIELANIELWLFGDGTAVDEIHRREEQDSRIKYFGRVPRETILAYERKATLLVNPRSVEDEFTKYSFPSKTIECMCSGTPLLTTRLKGIPQEYFEYTFTVDDNDPKVLADAFCSILQLTEEELRTRGTKARDFIRTQKNAVVQSKRVLDFLMSILGN